MKQMKFRSIFTMFLGLVALMGGLASGSPRARLGLASGSPRARLGLASGSPRARLGLALKAVIPPSARACAPKCHPVM